MTEQKKISEWLTLAGVESPSKPEFPNNEKFQLALGLILEELIEAAVSASDENVLEFLEKSIQKLKNEKIKIEKRGRLSGDLIELRDACADLRVVMGNMVHFSGINDKFNEDFNEVMDSNFSKFCKTEEEAQKTIEAYSNGTHPSKLGESIECYYINVGEYWIIKRKSDNKVLKSIGFVEPIFK